MNPTERFFAAELRRQSDLERFYDGPIPRSQRPDPIEFQIRHAREQFAHYERQAKLMWSQCLNTLRAARATERRAEAVEVRELPDRWLRADLREEARTLRQEALRLLEWFKSSRENARHEQRWLATLEPAIKQAAE